MSTSKRPQISPEQTKEMISMYEGGATFKEIAAKFERSPVHVYNLVRNGGATIREGKSKVPPGDLAGIVADYKAGVMVKELAIKWKRTKATISKILRAQGFPLYQGGRTCAINDDYLDGAMDEFRAHFIGMMLGDGCVCENSLIRLNLTESDRLILDTYRDLIQPGAKVARYEYKDGRGKPYCVLSLTSKRLCQRLAELGVGRRKSLTVEYPAWVKGHPCERHFLRGVWDADGWVKEYGEKRKTIMGICGSVAFIKEAAILLERMDIHCSIYTRGQILTLYVQRRDDCARLARYLYQDVKIAVPRKLISAQAMMGLDKLPDGRTCEARALRMSAPPPTQDIPLQPDLGF